MKSVFSVQGFKQFPGWCQSNYPVKPLLGHMAVKKPPSTIHMMFKYETSKFSKHL